MIIVATIIVLPERKPWPGSPNLRKLSLYELADYAVELLTKTPVVRIEDFEGALMEKFHDEWRKGQLEDMPGRKRKNWQNLVDWVKARLTMRGVTAYVDTWRARYLIYLPPICRTVIPEH
jgi:hypothetical protein